MKKLFMFLAVAGLATFGASCSSDDGGGDGGNGKPTLVAGASSLSVKVNESVTFTAIADGKAVDGVSFYEGNTKLSTTHKFTTIGDKKIVAKKDGFKDSAAITIKVTEDGTPVDPKQLTLTVMPAEVTLGQAVSFIVYEGTTDVTSTAKIFVNETLSGSSYTATAVGTYTVKATKEGAIDSVEKTFKVIEAPVVPEGNFIQVGGVYTSEINHARLLANCYEVTDQGENNGWHTYVYEEEDGSRYAIFYLDLGEVSGNSFLSRSQVAVTVDQGPVGTPIVLPGEGAFGFANAWAINFETQEDVDFAFEDITTFSFPTPGRDGVANYEVENENAHVKFNGNYEGVYVVPVDANGTPIQGRAAKSNRSVVGTEKMAKIK